MVVLKIDHITCEYEVFHRSKENGNIVQLTQLAMMLHKAKSNQIRALFYFVQHLALVSS